MLEAAALAPLVLATPGAIHRLVAAFYNGPGLTGHWNHGFLVPRYLQFVLYLFAAVLTTLGGDLRGGLSCCSCAPRAL